MDNHSDPDQFGKLLLGQALGQAQPALTASVKRSNGNLYNLFWKGLTSPRRADASAGEGEGESDGVAHMQGLHRKQETIKGLQSAAEAKEFLQRLSVEHNPQEAGLLVKSVDDDWMTHGWHGAWSPRLRKRKKKPSTTRGAASVPSPNPRATTSGLLRVATPSSEEDHAAPEASIVLSRLEVVVLNGCKTEAIGRRLLEVTDRIAVGERVAWRCPVPLRPCCRAHSHVYSSHLALSLQWWRGASAHSPTHGIACYPSPTTRSPFPPIPPTTRVHAWGDT